MGLPIGQFVFLVRIIINAWRKFTSARWPVYGGKIIGHRYRDNWGNCQCDYSEYRYKYFYDGNVFKGIYRVPYFVNRVKSARESSLIGTQARVRVCPADPARSILTNF